MKERSLAEIQDRVMVLANAVDVKAPAVKSYSGCPTPWEYADETDLETIPGGKASEEEYVIFLNASACRLPEPALDFLLAHGMAHLVYESDVQAPYDLRLRELEADSRAAKILEMAGINPIDAFEAWADVRLKACEQ